MSIDNISEDVKNKINELLDKYLQDLEKRTIREGFDISWIKDINSLIPLYTKILFDKIENLETKNIELQEKIEQLETQISLKKV